MKKKVPLSLVVTVIILAMTFTFTATFTYAQRIFNQNIESLQEKSITYDKLAKLDIIVRNNFYGTINEELMLNTISAGLMAGLDDENSKYLNSIQYSKYLENQANVRTNYGIETIKDELTGYARIIKVHKFSSAFEMGLIQNDLITRINEIEIKLLTESQIESLLLNSKAGNAKITYLSYLTGEEKTVELTIRKYNLETVSSKLLGSVGYVKIEVFNDSTPSQLNEILQKLLTDGAGSFVFDVRNVGGDNYDSASRILDMLLPSGILMKAEYDETSEKNTTIKTLYTSNSVEIDKPMVAIVNAKTWGCAELFALNLQEAKVLVVGEKTAGKGMLQEIYPQADGSAIQLTVAKILTGNNTTFADTGVMPSLEILLSKEQKEQWFTLTTQNDPQITKAISAAESLLKDAEIKKAPESVTTPESDSK